MTVLHTEAEARAVHGDALQVIRQDFAHNDRAQTEAAAEGFLKLKLVVEYIHQLLQ